VNDSYRINRFQLVSSLANALDLVSPHMANHHKRVAYIALRIAAAAAYSAQAKQEVVIAASLHDIGVLSTKERIESSLANSGHHSAAFGYELLRKFRPFRGVAELIRFQHVPWDHGRGQRFRDAQVPMGSHIINLANRVDSVIEPEVPILVQARAICRELNRLSGSLFVPEFVDALLRLAQSEAFWLDLVTPGHDELLTRHAVFPDIELDIDGLLEFAEMWGQVIDFRSRFTAAHSSGVAACAHALAQRTGFPEQRCRQIRVAGYLHDIGKLAIPVEVLEKPGRLSAADQLTVRAHSYYSYRILKPIAGLQEVAEWCGYHHEQLDGKGYPNGLDHTNLPLEARVVAVADVFAALTEDRPYRAGLGQAEVTRILRELADTHRLDPRVVASLCENYEEISAIRCRAQEEAVAGYDRFTSNLRALDLGWAREAHLQWMRLFREALGGGAGAPLEAFASAERCPQARWYAGEGRANYGDLPEFQALEGSHRELHRAVEQTLRCREVEGRGPAGDCIEVLERSSAELVEALDRVERAAGRRAARH
jgi:HD-GYP domain-containing protein (c-di-GMP phosphodiesterase class II)